MAAAHEDAARQLAAAPERAETLATALANPPLFRRDNGSQTGRSPISKIQESAPGDLR